MRVDSVFRQQLGQLLGQLSGQLCLTGQQVKLFGEFMIRYLLLISLILISSCGGGGSDSGASSDPQASSVSQAGDSVPANFSGVYNGSIQGSATALNVSLSDSFPISITVEQNRVRFDGDDPDETFSAGLRNDGTFSGVLNYDDDECLGNVQLEGIVDGTNASGSFGGNGSCAVGGNNIEVEITGTFTAAK
ncbi:hypothetical protein N9060_00400 [Arenicella sp.]|nr:hypothetical protein [Arenicella sp.]